MFENKTVWITGASSGIGAALARHLAKRGARLILSARRKDSLQAVAEQVDEAAGVPGTAFVLPLDVTDEAAMDTRVAEAKAFAGRIDMLFNNAGISQRSTVLETDMATYRTLFEVDVLGQIALTKAVLPVMLAQGGGHVAVTSSVAGKIGAPKRSGYCAAKHAVMGFFDALRAEMDGQGIKVTTITPGFIRTPISENALKGDGTKFGETDSNIAGGMDVDDCARAIVRGMEKGRPEIPVGKGKEMHALWLKRFFPRLVFRMAGKLG
ncbi:SDR family oxidoreductase [Yunchengibacter salinarum]|uniref:SDR family oxidoreductase n=1 Tax=Yunchengibacter salinarum TaxID=3133399 RepID=UPI0035B6A52F